MKTKLHLLLVIAVLASGLAWAPSVRAAAGGDQAAPAVAGLNAPRILTLRIVNNQLGVSGSGFTKNRRYLVQARSSDLRGWYVLGSLRAKSTGKISGAFRLPPRLVNAQVVRVCLVDAFSGATFCRWIVRR